MVIRYNYIKKIKSLFGNDYFYNYWLNNTLKLNNFKQTSLLKYNSNNIKKKLINVFRYFFWIFSDLLLTKKLLLFINYYKYLLNFILLLNYLKQNNINYYLLYYISNVDFIKKNKKIQRKFINYITLKQKVDILFFFKLDSFKTDFFYNSLKKNKLNIFEINVINSKSIYLFLYLTSLV
jgi:hypothetical protein